MVNNIVIVGGSGAIGTAFTLELSVSYHNAIIHAFSRQQPEKVLPDVTCHTIDYLDETSIEKTALVASSEMPIDMVIAATGILHDGELMPEKSLEELSVEKFQRLFEVNTIAPALLAKHFLPKLNREKRSIFAVLSARVGSISDNQLGGWYAYRASKAALNMVIKNVAIEIGRSNKKAIIVGLHPGTVDSDLSRPFQRNVPDGKMFTPEYSVQKLLEVLTNELPNPECVKFVFQENPLGLGHAIWCAREFFSENEFFAIVLPDDVILGPEPCLKELVSIYENHSCNVISVMEVEKQNVSKI